jgi:hypothetical protein
VPTSRATKMLWLPCLLGVFLSLIERSKHSYPKPLYCADCCVVVVVVVVRRRDLLLQVRELPRLPVPGPVRLRPPRPGQLRLRALRQGPKASLLRKVNGAQ